MPCSPIGAIDVQGRPEREFGRATALDRVARRTYALRVGFAHTYVDELDA